MHSSLYMNTQSWGFTRGTLLLDICSERPYVASVRFGRSSSEGKQFPEMIVQISKMPRITMPDTTTAMAA